LEDIMKRLLLPFVFLLALGSVVSAQSLQEVAQKEKQRRKKVEAKGGQAYTDRDLTTSVRPAPQASSTAGATATVPTEQEGEAEAAPAEVDPTTTQSYWRDRASAIHKRIADLETRLKSPELNENVRAAPAREAAERDLAKARTDLRALADEARRKGVPPGWVR
jgi:hypothetical protein